jgi:hypothetical protein
VLQIKRFLESIVALEETRLKEVDIDEFFMEEFQINSRGKRVQENVLYKVQETWSHGLLQLFIKNKILSDKIEVKDIIAFESARLLKFILESEKLEILDTREAWGLIILNLQRLQESFSNGKIFKEAYLKGRLYYDILFKEAEEERSTRIQNYDTLLHTLQNNTKHTIFWISDNLFDAITISEEATQPPKKILQKSEDKQLNKLYQLLMLENKIALFEVLDKMEEKERNHYLPLLTQENNLLRIEAYLELPKKYPNVSYPYYLRGMYFYYFAWETRGTGIANTVGQKNYANFYERLRYAKKDLKTAYKLSPNEQTYWAELYNIAKHFNSEEADELEEKLIQLIRENAMYNVFCVRRVANMKKARWGGSHQESLEWAREVVLASKYGKPIKIMLFEAYLEQYDYILTLDKNEKEAQALLDNQAIQDEVNEYFEELLENIEDENIYSTLLFWYTKVGDEARLKELHFKLRLL